MRVFVRWGKIFVIAALVIMTGGHWMALQTLAWTTMLVKNLQTQSVSQAVSQTFDGEHPCCLCKAIKAGKNAEKKSETVAPVLKMEFTPVAEKIILYPPANFDCLPLENSFATAFTSPPLLPPPRVGGV